MPATFLSHASRRLSVALQSGNAGVALQGTTDLLRQSQLSAAASELRLPTSGGGRGPGRNQLRRTASAMAEEAATRAPGVQFGSILHSDYRSARVGVRGGA